VLAICDRRYRKSAERVAGIRPLTCPPRLVKAILWPNWLASELIYIDLHGRLGEPEWLFAEEERVLHIRDVPETTDKVIFATTCFLKETEFFDVFRKNKLIYGEGANFGLRDRAIGAPLLALWFRRVYEKTCDIELSLRVAKTRVALTSWARSADKDALQFRIAL